MKKKEKFRWLFMNGIPYMFSNKHLARMMEIELWLGLESILESLDLKQPKQSNDKTSRYIV